MNKIDPSILDKENRHISVLDKENPNKLPDNFRRPVPAKLIINSLPKLFNCLFKVYLKPLAQSSNVRALSFTMFLSFLNVAAFLSDMPTVPEFSDLKTTEGIIDFDKPTKRGIHLMILRKNKDPLILICAGGANVSHDCIYPEQKIEEYRGKQAKVWWLEQQTLLGMREKLVQYKLVKILLFLMSSRKKISIISWGNNANWTFYIAFIPIFNSDAITLYI
jgi:hypothetical protein